MESFAIATLNLLEVMKFFNPHTRLCSAGSSECFGDTGAQAITEITPFNPFCPNDIAISNADQLVKNIAKLMEYMHSRQFSSIMNCLYGRSVIVAQ